MKVDVPLKLAYAVANVQAYVTTKNQAMGDRFVLGTCQKLAGGGGVVVEIFSEVMKIKWTSRQRGLKCPDPALELVLKFHDPLLDK